MHVTYPYPEEALNQGVRVPVIDIDMETTFFNGRFDQESIVNVMRKRISRVLQPSNQRAAIVRIRVDATYGERLGAIMEALTKKDNLFADLADFIGVLVKQESYEGLDAVVKRHERVIGRGKCEPSLFGAFARHWNRAA